MPLNPFKLRFQHIKSGCVYELVTLANTTAKKPEYVTTVVYKNKQGEVFSRPFDEFIEKFVLVVDESV